MAGYANSAPVTPLLLQGTGTLVFKAGQVNVAGGAAKDTLVYGYHILSNGTAVTITLAGFLDSNGAAASIVWTGSTTQDTIIVFPVPLLNQGGPFTATPSVAAKVWLYLGAYLGGPT